jgi:hypothetical protein
LDAVAHRVELTRRRREIIFDLEGDAALGGFLNPLMWCVGGAQEPNTSLVCAAAGVAADASAAAPASKKCLENIVLVLPWVENRPWRIGALLAKVAGTRPL